jgi:secreted PhoX family phosphatase
MPSAAFSNHRRHQTSGLTSVAGLVVTALATASAVAQTYRWTTLAGTAGVAGCGDSPAAVARFNRPQGIAIDAAGHVYVADAGNLTLRRITPEGVVTTLAGYPGGSGAEDGPGTSARFESLDWMAIDRLGNLIVTANAHLRRIAPDGTVTTLGRTDGNGLAVDHSGVCFTTHTVFGVVERIAPGGESFTFSGKGSWQARGFGFIQPGQADREVDGPADRAVFFRPDWHRHRARRKPDSQ